MRDLKEKTLNIEIGVVEKVRNAVKRWGTQYKFAKKMGLKKDVLNRKLNGRSGITQKEWDKMFRILTRHKWDERYNQIPEGLTDKQYDEEVEIIQQDIIPDPETYPLDCKAVYYAVEELLGYGLSENECRLFIENMEKRYCHIKIRI